MMAGEVAPFGIGVTILVTGTYDTEIITDAGTTDTRDFDGPYAPHHSTMDKRGRAMIKQAAKSPEVFAAAMANALDDSAPFVRRAAGPDARILLAANRLLPAAVMHQMTRLLMGLPRQGQLRPGAVHLTAGQQTMMLAARVLPAPVLQRIVAVGMRLSSTKNTSESEDHG